ncbi:MAG: hypothetical protein KDC46_00965 [Thermoleophilia bacterium]|nr:hypothetical protein [Thermoleophilia bacterium]
MNPIQLNLAVGAGAGILAAAATTTALIAHDRSVVDKLETREERNDAVDQFSGAIDSIGWVGFAAAMLTPNSWSGASAIKAGGWGVMIGNYAAKEITQSVVLNRVEDKGNRWNPFDNKLTVGPKGD